MDAKIDMLQRTYLMNTTPDSVAETEEPSFNEDSFAMPTVVEFSVAEETEQTEHEAESSEVIHIEFYISRLELY